jgi:hypothetical protein
MIILLSLLLTIVKGNDIIDVCIKDQAPCIYFNIAISEAKDNQKCETCLDISPNCIWIDHLDMMNVTGEICSYGKCYKNTQLIKNVNGYCMDGGLFYNHNINIECDNLTIVGIDYDVDIKFEANTKDFGDFYWETCKVDTKDMGLIMGLISMFIVFQCCTCFLCWFGIPRCCVCPRRVSNDYNIL